MKWLVRTAVALSLLTCLGYASYTFGMYVLSKKLFGDTILQKAPVDSASRSARVTKSFTRKSGDKSGKPRVEVNVLEAQDAGPGPQAPSLDSMERDTRTRDYDSQPMKSRQRIVTAESLKAVKRSYRDDDSENLRDYARENDENRPRRRRRRRRRRSTSEMQSNTTTRNARRESDSGTSSSSDDSSSRESSESRSERPRERRRERESSSDSPRRERRIESPVPSEGGGGSSSRESPVPVPE